MELQVGKSYRLKNDIFNFKKGEVWLLADEGYQAYYGEQNFVFVNAEKTLMPRKIVSLWFYVILQMKIWK